LPIFSLLWDGTVFGSDNLTWQVGSSAQVAYFPGVDWKIMGVGDLNGDSKPDIVLQNDVVGQKAVWLMNGVTMLQGLVIDSSTGSQWQIRAVGEFNVPAANPPKADLVLQNVLTKQLAIWFMDGVVMTGGQYVSTAPGDFDWRVVNAADFNGDGQTDIMYRYVTNGRNTAWLMNSYTFTGNVYLKPEPEIAMKVLAQDWSDSIWRQSDEFHPQVTATVTASSPHIATINFRLKSNNGSKITIRRRIPPSTAWTTTSGISATATSWQALPLS